MLLLLHIFTLTSNHIYLHLFKFKIIDISWRQIGSSYGYDIRILLTNVKRTYMRYLPRSRKLTKKKIVEKHEISATFGDKKQTLLESFSDAMWLCDFFFAFGFISCLSASVTYIIGICIRLLFLLCGLLLYFKI